MALLLAALFHAASCAGESEGPRPKNVLLIVIDTLRSDHLGCYSYGRDTSPEIDWLAENGTLYENCFSQACWTVPSMISMMTGFHVTEEESTLSPDLIVLGEALSAQGLETAAFPANPTLHQDRGFARGFDTFVPIRPRAGDDIVTAFDAWYGDKLAEPTRKDKGFFVWVQFTEPHLPYKPDEQHDLFTGQLPEQAQLAERWRFELPRVAELTGDLDQQALDFRKASAKMHRFINRYDGEVHQADAGVGALIDRLRQSGDLEDTLVIVASDHGEMLFEHPQEPHMVHARIKNSGGLPDGVMELFTNGHRAWYYDDLWNTPLILYGPGIPAGVRRQGLAANLDIFPTILEALGLPYIPSLHGQSLFTGREPVRERVFAFGYGSTAVREADGKKAIISPRTLYLLEGEGPDPTSYYDLSIDPDELRDLSEEQQAEVARLRSLMEEWHVVNKRKANTETTEAQLKILRELGYVGDESDPESESGM